jgi:hypothetical protein
MCSLLYVLSVLIYSLTLCMAHVAKFDGSGKVLGIQVNGNTPYLHTVTSGPVGVPTTLNRSLFSPALYLVETNENLVNPNVLKDNGVRVCAGTIYYDRNPPAWCDTADVKDTVFCPVAYEWGCQKTPIDIHGIYSWVAHGYGLRVYEDPSSVGYVFTATAAMVCLIIVDYIPSKHSFSWAPKEVASVALAVSLMMSFNWSFIIVASVAFGVAISNKSKQLIVTSLRASLVITVSECLLDYNIDSTAVGLSRVIAAAVVSIGAGARGSLWSLPWAVVRGVYPTIEESYTIHMTRKWEMWTISALIVTGAFLIGLASSAPGQWRRHLGLPNSTRRSYSRPMLSTGALGTGKYFM